MIDRASRLVAIALLAVSCVSPTGPGDPTFGQVRFQPAFASGETPADLRLSIDSVWVEIMRSGEATPLVDTAKTYVADEVLTWLLGVVSDPERFPARLELRDASGVLYEGSGTLNARPGVINVADVHAVTMSYVGPPRAMSVAVTPDQATLDAIGATVALTATARDGDGNVMAGKTFAWTTSEPAVATVDASGAVTAVGEGDATISAEVDGLSDAATVAVRVKAAPGTSTIDAAPTRLTADGASVSTVTVTLFDANGHQLGSGGSAVTLSSTLGQLGPVTDGQDGTYTANLSSTAAGAATVTGTVDGAAIADDVTVVFEPGSPSANTATISADPAVVEADGSMASTITVQVFDANGKPVGKGGDAVVLATTLGTTGAVTDHDAMRYPGQLHVGELYTRPLVTIVKQHLDPGRLQLLVQGFGTRCHGL